MPVATSSSRVPSVSAASRRPPNARRRHAVAGVAGDVADVLGAVEAARERQVTRRPIDRASPRVRQPEVRELGEEAAEVAGDDVDGPPIVLHRPRNAAEGADRAPAAPERDAPVAGHVRVVDEQPLVAERLAARPADPRDALGRGLGQHDVARDRHDRPSQVRDAREPGVRGEHHGIGLDRSPRRLDQRGPVATQREHRRVLEDADAGLERGGAQAARVQRRLHRGPVGIEDSGERERTAGAARGSRLPRAPAPSPAGRPARARRAWAASARSARGTSPSRCCRPGGSRGCRARRGTPRPRGSPACWPRRARAPARSPKRSSSSGSSSHHDVAKPPLRPEAPPPQMSPSSTTTEVSGERRRSSSAVHSPV